MIEYYEIMPTEQDKTEIIKTSSYGHLHKFYTHRNESRKGTKWEEERASGVVGRDESIVDIEHD